MMNSGSSNIRTYERYVPKAEGEQDMKQLKIAIIGSGSTYTPELIEGLIARKNSLAMKSIYMMDINREKNEIVGSLVRRMLSYHNMQTELVLTESLEAAVQDADYILGQIRVGMLDARIKDEKIPLKYDLIGQETTGIGGFMKAMRTIPVMMNVAKTIENLAPDAWLINFSNPSGLLAEALLNHTNVKTIGLCNNPVNMIRDAKKRLPENTEIFDYDYVGLNHLSWMTAIYADGIEILQDQLKSNATVSTAKNIPQIEYDDSLLQAAGGLPCAYLSYFYHRDKMLNKLKKAEFSRGEECKKIEQELLERYRDSTVLEKPVQLEKRGGSLYSEAAISLIDAMENDKNEIHVINTQNKGAFPFMEKEDVVECKCLVGKHGVMPVPFNGIVNEHIIGLMKTIKSYEKLAVTAGIQGDRNAALRAMLVHPLIGDYEKANAALDEMFEANREYLPQFFKVEEK